MDVEQRTARVRVFGGMGVDDGGEPLSIGGVRQRRLLALLAIRSGSVVSTDWLAEYLWSDEDRPAATTPAIRTYLSRLRQRLPEDAKDWIQTEAAGYRFAVPPEQIEHHRFSILREKALRARESEDPQRAQEHLDEALALWRGDPFRELEDLDWAIPELEQLRVDRLETLEERWEVSLAQGRHTQITGELAAFTAEHGLRDRAAQQYALALHRSGRTAEALRVIEDHRRTLAEQSGLDPSPGIVELEQRMLVGDPSLDVEMAGRPLRGYRLLEEIGSGAFAVVWRGVQPSVDREVAIKQIRSDLASRPEFIRRFEAEAHLVARIEHPYIVPLFDFWRDPESAYLVMRWLRGGTLERRLDDGPLSVEDTRRLARQMCGALAAAHEHGIVHRDVKSGNILFDESGNAFLGDFGIALEATVSAGPEAALSTGSPAYSSPEQLRREQLGPQADIFSLGVVLFECLAGSLPFHDSKSVSELIDHQLNTEYPRLIELRADVPASISNAVAKATSKDAADRFSSMDEFLQALGGHETLPLTEGPDVVSTLAANPYKGLRAFDTGDSDEFFGRERLVDQLLRRLSGSGVRSRCLIVVGPSGSGKSSVVRAGLVPSLGAGAVPGSQDWFTTTMVPGTDPFESLEAALLRIAINPPEALLTLLKDGNRGILRAIRQCLASDDDIGLLVIDQFEEVFTNSTDAVANQFLDALSVAVEDPTSPLRLVVTLRADYYDRPLAHPTFARVLDEAIVNLKPLAPDELELAMVEPARRVGVGFEPGLVARMAADAIGQPSPLPLVQYTLAELFDRRDGDQLTIRSYDELGRVAGALTARAEDIYTGADDPQRAAVRRIFGRIVNPGEESADLRRRVPIADLGDDPAVRWTLDEFGAARLVTFDRDTTTREPTVEVAHEALLREWPRLVTWLNEDAELLRSIDAIAAAVAVWDESGRATTDLYRGGRLESAVDLALTAPDRLRPVDAEFIRASQAASDAERRTEQRGVRRLRRLVVGIGAALVVAVVAGGLALREQQRADSQAERAQIAAADAIEQADVADQQTEKAVAATESAELATLISRSAAKDIDDPKLSVLLALEAHRRSPGTETEQALLNALGSSAVPNRITSQPRLSSPAPGCDNPRSTFRTSSNRDGTREFGVANGELVSRDPLTGSIVEHGPPPADCVFWMADEALDRRWAGSMDGLTMWFGPYDGPWEVEKHYAVTTALVSTSFMPTGNLVAIASSGGAFVTLLDDQTGELVGTALDAGEVTGRIDVSPDGQFVVAEIASIGVGAVSDSAMVVLDGVTGEERFRIETGSPHVSPAHGFDARTGELLLGLEDGTIRTIDLATGQTVSTVETTAAAGFVALGVRPDGLVVAVSSGQIELVDREVGVSGSPIDIGDVADARIRPDGSLLLITSGEEVEILDLDGTALVQRTFDVDPLAATTVNDGQVGTIRNPNGTPTMIDLATGERTILNLISPGGARYDAVGVWPTDDGFWARGVDHTITRWNGDEMVERFELAGRAEYWEFEFGAHAVLTSSLRGPVAQLFSLDGDNSGLVFTVPADDGLAVHPSRDGGLHLVDLNGTLRTFDSAGVETANVSIRSAGINTTTIDARTFNVITVDPASGQLAIGSSAGVVIVDPLTGELASLSGSQAAANLHFINDGALLAVTGRDGTVRLWDVEQRVSTGLVWSGTGSGGSASWYDETTDSLWVNTSGKVLEIPLDPASWVERACELVGRDLTQDEWDQFVPGDTPLISACR